MSFGIEILGPGGPWFRMTDRLVRHVDYFTVTTQSGSRTIPGLGQNGFFMVHSDGGPGSGSSKWSVDQPAMTAQHFWRDGDTLRWNYPYRANWSPLDDRDARPRVFVTVVLFR